MENENLTIEERISLLEENIGTTSHALDAIVSTLSTALAVSIEAGLDTEQKENVIGIFSNMKTKIEEMEDGIQIKKDTSKEILDSIVSFSKAINPT